MKSKTYEEFVEKFKPKKTTDDCYTPSEIYEAISKWVEEEYHVSRENFVRPFYPGGDFENYPYKKEDIVVDNPPFSIETKILDFYKKNGIRYFLFAKGNIINYAKRATLIACRSTVTYENGACVCTNFVTNLEEEEICARTAPSLNKAIKVANEKYLKSIKAHHPKYSYPDEVVTAAQLGCMSIYGINFKLYKKDTRFISGLDSQKSKGKGIFGGGLLLSEKAAAEKAAAEKAAAEKAAAKKAAAEKAAAEKAAVEKWELSERELEIVKSLGG